LGKLFAYTIHNKGENMSGTYFVVDHVSDGNKTDGLIESYQMIPVQYDNGQGGLSSGYKRLNYVHWPNIPHPFVHEEWNEDLVFSNIYSPADDAGEDEDEDEEDFDDYSDDEEEANFDGEEGGTTTELEG
jgi:hypothetical protein